MSTATRMNVIIGKIDAESIGSIVLMIKSVIPIFSRPASIVKVITRRIFIGRISATPLIIRFRKSSNFMTFLGI